MATTKHTNIQQQQSSNNNNQKIEIRNDPKPCDLWEFLRIAAHEDKLDTVKSHPDLYPYVDGFGSEKGDIGVLAVVHDDKEKNNSNVVVGAAWVRIGRGYVKDDTVPELAIGVQDEYQGQGIGTQLLKALFPLVEQAGYTGITLSVRDDNDSAIHVYERLGFQRLNDSDKPNRVGGSSFSMIKNFSSTKDSNNSNDDNNNNMVEPSKVYIRKATKEDIPLILNLIQHKAQFDRNMGSFQGQLSVTSEKLEKTMFNGDNPFSNVILAVSSSDNNSIMCLGFASYYFQYSTFRGQPSLWLDDLYVEEQYRSQGIGKQLMKELTTIAKTNDCSHISWHADTRNEKGLHFYQTKLGATIVDESKTTNRCTFQWVPPF